MCRGKRLPEVMCYLMRGERPASAGERPLRKVLHAKVSWGERPASAGGALGKEGRKYGVGMGKNCPFMRETTALKPTMDGVGMGENCPFMHGKRLLYSIDLLGGGAGYLCRWG